MGNQETSGVLGDIQIADEVVAVISGLAALEVEGVARMSGNIPNELISKLGTKNLSRGVKVMLSPESVSVDLSLDMKYGYSIPKVSAEVQEKVKSEIENMTGLQCDQVNVRIVGVVPEKQVEEKSAKTQRPQKNIQINRR